MVDLLYSLDPSTGETVGSVNLTEPTEVPAIVSRARVAYKTWRRLSFSERAQAIAPAGQKLLERADELGALLTKEMGKPIREAVGEVKSCGASFEKKIEEIGSALEPEVIEDGSTRSTIYFDPLGVCAAITPWNFPLAMPHWLVLPALLAGNSVIMKPSEETPLIGKAYADILIESLPDQVLQVVHGNEVVGKALVEADIDLIAFTGSREAGKHILASASAGLKRVILELGGKDPLIVLKDADLEKAARFAVSNSFRNAGQVCVSTERIFVDASIASDFELKMVEYAEAMQVGRGDDEKTQVGPMINDHQRQHVLKQIEEACAKGARRVFSPDQPEKHFLRPTILSDIPEDASILSEETFGPVACLTPYQDVNEAIEAANASKFGLGAAVFGSEAAASEVARQLEAGMIGINKGCGGAQGTPWVGAKESGYGFHGSRAGHRQFCQTRVVSSPIKRD